jgi:rhodanese-related sulfurtransferase
MTPRGFKDRVYAEFARVAQALASDSRLELVDLLAQTPRRVDALAAETGMTLANVSQHLQVLKNARLVESERRGTAVVYRLAAPAVTSVWLALREVAAERLPEIGRLRDEFVVDGAIDVVRRDDARRLFKRRDAVLIDVRPEIEFAHGHVTGAISIPIEELDQRMTELPRNKRIIAYCRGEYCLLADEAVARLRKSGFDAMRLEGGWPEWSLEESKRNTSLTPGRRRTMSERGAKRGSIRTGS